MPIINSGGLELSDSTTYTLGQTPAADPANVAHLPTAGFCPRCTGVLHRTTELAEDGRPVCVCDACGREFVGTEGAPLPPLWWQNGER